MGMRGRPPQRKDVGKVEVNKNKLEAHEVRQKPLVGLAAAHSGSVGVCRSWTLPSGVGVGEGTKGTGEVGAITASRR